MSFVTVVAGIPLMVGIVLEVVGAVLGTLVTVIENAGSDTLSTPSLTVMTIPLVVPIFALLGVPLRVPVLLSKFVQTGRLVILKIILSPSASFALGVKL